MEKTDMPGEVRHICMAEDDPDDYYFFSKILREIDGSVKLTWFQSCEGLLETLKEGTDVPDVIVLDMNMPKMDGQTCLATLKRDLSLLHIPVIIFSTAGSPTAIKTAYQTGAFKYIFKPHSVDGLRSVINDILATPLN